MTVHEFAFRFDRVALPLRALGVRPSTSWVRVDETHLDVRFGHWRCTTPLTNIKDVQITYGYTAIKAIGARASFTDGGATFGSSIAGGVCTCFHEKVSALRPAAVHPGLTMTVEDLDGLAALLRERCGLD